MAVIYRHRKYTCIYAYQYIQETMLLPSWHGTIPRLLAAKSRLLLETRKLSVPVHQQGKPPFVFTTRRSLSQQPAPKGSWKEFKDDFIQEAQDFWKDLSWKECRETARDSGILLYRLALAYGCYYCINEYAFFLVMCDGPSMLPTMQNAYSLIQ